MNLDRLKDIIAAVDIDDMQVGEEKELDNPVNIEVRDCPVTIINSKLQIGSDGSTHADNISKYLEDNNLENENDIESMGFAHCIGKSVVLEINTLSNLTQEEAVKVLKQKFDKVYATDDVIGTTITRLAKKQ